MCQGNKTANAVDDFLTASYLGFAPAVPAHGPDAPTGFFR